MAPLGYAVKFPKLRSGPITEITSTHVIPHSDILIAEENTKKENQGGVRGREKLLTPGVGYRNIFALSIPMSF